jgi:hypothetical protein
MKKNEKKINTNYISASDIGQYQYCSISWKLKKQGYEPNTELLNIGRNKHISHGDLIDNSEKLIKNSKKLSLISYILLILAAIIVIIEVLL